MYELSVLESFLPMNAVLFFMSIYYVAGNTPSLLVVLGQKKKENTLVDVFHTLEAF